MEASYIIVILALMTMLGVFVFALVSKHKVEKRLADDNAPKSTLAADKASDGIPIDV